MTTCSEPMALSVDDEEMFLRLVDQHRGIIRKVAAGYCQTMADQHDLSQEIMLQLWKAYPRYAPDRPFATSMYRIALNVAVSFLRRNTRRIRQTVPLEPRSRQGTYSLLQKPGQPERAKRSVAATNS